MTKIRKGGCCSNIAIFFRSVQGYHLYYGIAPVKLYNSVMVYKDTTYQLNGLNVNPEYYFAIEAFNENGISERSPVNVSPR